MRPSRPADAVAHQVHRQRVNDEPVEQVEIGAGRLDARDDLVRREATVGDYWAHELERHQVERVAPIPTTSAGSASTRAHRRGMAYGKFRNTRSMPMWRRFDMPTGRSLPGS